MSQQATMTMAGMGGPVGAINAATPNTTNVDFDPAEYSKRLNTYIYDYFLRNQHYDCARMMLTKNLPLAVHSKSPSNQRQANGLDDMDSDAKDVDRPKDLPLPDLPSTGGHFLEDWWAQFWDIYTTRRSGGKAGTVSYLQLQRNAQKARSGMMGTAEPAMQRNFSMMNGAGMTPGDLKKAAMQNAGNMNSNMQAQMARARAQGQPQMMQGNPMERQVSQMDARSGSPGSNGAPSPKRPRVEGGMQQMGQQRPGQPGQMPNNPSLEMYNASMQAQMKHGLNQAQESSNLNKGMNPNPAANLAAMQAAAAAAAAAANAQGSPMPQGAMDGVMADFQNGNLRAGMLQGAAALQAQGPNSANNANGSHALQDYQMQLMLLEQQNKRRLLMARQEQDGIAHHQGVPNANGQGSPAPVSFDPNNLPPQVRNQMMMAGPNGPMGQRPNPQQMAQTQSQMEMFNRQAAGQMMVGNNFPQGMPPGLMPGQQPGQPLQPGQTAPNMTPRQGNNQMPPPPAPQQNTTSGTNPSSPAAAVAPPTPSQSAKSKPAAKKDTKASKAAAKKGGNTTAATPASEAEQAPTPTPQTPMTPMPGKGPNANQNAAFTNGGMNSANSAQANGQQQPGQAPGVMQQPGQPDLGGFGMDAGDQFMLGDFSMDGNPGDVLDNFDFDAFLNPTDGGDGLPFGDFGNFDGVGDVAATDALGQ